MVSEKPWRPELVLLLGAGMMLTVSVSGLLMYAIQKKNLAPEFVTALGGTLSMEVVALILLHVFLRIHKTSWSDFFGLRRRRLFLVLTFAVGVAVVTIPMAWGLNYVSATVIRMLHGEPAQQAVVKILEGITHPLQRAAFGVVAIVLAPVVEEALFRGILYPLLKQNGFPILSVLVTSLLFAAVHFNVMTFLPLFFFALVLTWIYERTDTLLAPIVAHALFNTVNFVLFLNQPAVERWLESLGERI